MGLEHKTSSLLWNLLNLNHRASLIAFASLVETFVGHVKGYFHLISAIDPEEFFGTDPIILCFGSPQIDHNFSDSVQSFDASERLLSNPCILPKVCFLSILDILENPTIC